MPARKPSKLFDALVELHPREWVDVRSPRDGVCAERRQAKYDSPLELLEALHRRAAEFGPSDESGDYVQPWYVGVWDAAEELAPDTLVACVAAYWRDHGQPGTPDSAGPDQFRHTQEWHDANPPVMVSCQITVENSDQAHGATEFKAGPFVRQS